MAIMSISIPKEQKELLKEWAREDDRSASSILRFLISEETKRRADIKRIKAERREMSQNMTWGATNGA